MRAVDVILPVAVATAVGLCSLAGSPNQAAQARVGSPSTLEATQPVSTGLKLVARRSVLTPVRTLTVSRTGSDNASGTVSSPLRTIQAAVNRATAGTVVSVEPGRYSAFVVTSPSITIRARKGATVTVSGDHAHRDVIRVHAPNVTIADLSVSGCIARDLPANNYESAGASGIAVDPTANGTRITHDSISSKPRKNRYGLRFGCYGVAVRGAANVSISYSRVFHNGYGIFLLGSGRGVVVAHNEIHDNDAIIRNTPRPGDDFGAVGVGLMNVRSNPGAQIYANRIYSNSAPSHDYNTDGGAFELYNSSHVSIPAPLRPQDEDRIELADRIGLVDI
jgi:parallel beta-helix repeat protein